MRSFELILPAYNEAQSLQGLIDGVVRAAQKYQFTPETFRLIIVNNGSTDASKDILLKLSKDPSLRDWFAVTEVKTNSGYGYGLYQGLKNSEAPIIGWSHADLQCAPEDCFFGWKILASAHDHERVLVKGRRHGRSVGERFVSAIFAFLGKIILGLCCDEINAQPKIFHRRLLEHLKDPPANFSFDLYTLYQAQREGWKFQTIDVSFPPRVHGHSHWSHHWRSRLRTMGKTFLYMLTLSLREGPLWKS